MCRTSQPIRRVFAVMMTSKTLVSPVCLQVMKTQPRIADLNKIVKNCVKGDIQEGGRNIDHKVHVVPIDIPFDFLLS